MRSMESRLRTLESRQRRQHRPLGHFTSIVRVPRDILYNDWLDWLAAQPCACRQTYCENRRVGALLPEKCESPEEWAAWYGPGAKL